MESILPGEILSAMEVGRRNNQRSRSRHLVVVGERQHRIMDLSDDGFVIEADSQAEGLPHLRGYVEILKGDERIARRLAVFAWARDGLVGYEFKHDATGHGREAPVDYVKPERQGLLAAPEE